MLEPLWDWQTLVAVSEGQADGEPAHAVTGFSIDTRMIRPGEVFVALTDQRDGHAFVGQAFAAGAAAALVRRDYERGGSDAALLRVDDPLRALERIAAAARARLSPEARVVAVTGSAGKTTTKEMLRAAFEAIAPGQVHASIKSYNNHWGVPLTLANMPAATRLAAIEMGMNHADEIRPLSRLARPHVAVITSVLPVHIGNFADGIEGIARAKAEIFEGVVPGGTVIVPAEGNCVELLRGRARDCLGAAADVRTFGSAASATVRIGEISAAPSFSDAQLWTEGACLHVRVGVAGRHNVGNAAAVLLAVRAVAGADDHDAAYASAMADLRLAPQGRGQVYELAEGITLIDESYNANPASVRAALDTLSLRPRERRRVAVLGDMLELGEAAAELHAGLADAVEAADATLYCCGPLMRSLYDAVGASRSGAWAPDAESLTPMLLDAARGVRPGDIVMIKGSLGSRMGPLTAALKDRYAELNEGYRS